MQFLRHLGGPIALFVVLVVFMVLGLSSLQTGWIAIGLLCIWPLFWGVMAWTLRGLRDSYQLVPKAANAQMRSRREVRGAGESLG